MNVETSAEEQPTCSSLSFLSCRSRCLRMTGFSRANRNISSRYVLKMCKRLYRRNHRLATYVEIIEYTRIDLSRELAMDRRY